MRITTASDAGDIVIGWLVRLVAALAVVGVLAFDGISLGVASLGVADDAAAAARTASTALATGSTPQEAYTEAWETVAGRPGTDVPAPSFVVGADRSVTLTVTHEVPTLVLRHVPRSEDWLTVSATATHRVD